MLLYFSMVICGISLLVWSADRFTDGATAIARNFGVSPLVVGLTIVAMGSSAPEVVVSINAALNDTPGLALGNAIGSNIANIAMVLGITALVVPLKVQSVTLKREIPILFLFMLLVFFLLSDLVLSFWDGIILISSLVAYLGWLIYIATIGRNNQRSTDGNDLMLSEIINELPDKMPNSKAIFWVLLGLLILQVSSKMLVFGATNIAYMYGVTDYVIGITIVAVGTSLPELAASVSSVLKGEHELAIGNVIGSNIFNLLIVLGIPGLITQVNIPPSILQFDYAIMFGLTVAMSIMAWGSKGKPGEITRLEGGLLLSCFVGYQTYQLFFNS